MSLTIADLERSLAYYTDAIGLTVLIRQGANATLGVSGTPLLLLSEQPDAKPWPRGGRSYAGLYHFALLLPTRADLGRWIVALLVVGLPMPGQGDHLVREEVYLQDADGHVTEVYRVLPRDEWQLEGGRVRMASDPVDIHGLLREAEQAGQPWSGMPAGTRVGHIHLQVGDIPQASTFYHGVLGFDIVAEWPSALFISAGGYHHHIGMNTWHSRGAGPAPADSVNLRFFTIDLPDEEARRAVVDRLKSAGIATTERDGLVAVRDPWGITIVLRAGTSTDPQIVQALAVPFAP